ncbi:MAG: holliday junction helicase RuvA [Frankiaceae bacterium]|jgi:Holliday junction DNA helicase RuvA|nr:holliday junction helicase RuvA [Frankiaceae bacterium]
MIASVSGVVTALTAEVAIIEVGGFGIAVLCTAPTLTRLRVGEQARLSTSLVVREDSLTLFGFADEAERTTFELLQTATGVGPKLAQAVLSTLSPGELRHAIITEDLAALMRVSGVGKKGAQRLVLELAERVGVLPHIAGVPEARPPTRAQGGPAWQDHVRNALVSLGYSPREAEDAVARVVAESTREAATGAAGEDVIDASSALRRALSSLAGA